MMVCHRLKENCGISYLGKARARILKAFSLRGKILDDVELTKRTDDFVRYYAVNQIEHTKRLMVLHQR